MIRLNSLRDFLKIWFFWKKQAIFLFSTIIGLVLVYSYACTYTYESTAKILLLPRATEGLITTGGADEKHIIPVSIQDINTEIEILTSDDVIKDTINSFSNFEMGLKVQASVFGTLSDLIKNMINNTLLLFKLKEPLSTFDANVMHLKNSLDVKSLAMSNIIMVAFQSENPQTAADVLNKFLEIYITHHNKAFIKDEGTQFFSDQSAIYRKKLETAEKNLNEFQKKWDIVSLKKQNEASIQLLADLKRELNRTEMLYDEAENRITTLKRSLQENQQEIIITKEMRTVPSIVELGKGLVPLLLKKSEILKSFTTTSREYLDIQYQIKMLLAEIRNETIKSIKADEIELDGLRIKKMSMQKKIKQIQNEATALNQKEIIQNAFEREVVMHKKNFMLYASKTEDARIFTERNKRNLANVSIADKASVPVKPVAPKRLLLLIISVIVGFFAALGIPFVLEFLDQRIKTADDIEEYLSLPVVCNFPEIKDLNKFKPFLEIPNHGQNI